MNKLRVFSLIGIILHIPVLLSAQNEKQLAAFNQLKTSSSSINIRWNSKTGTPKHLSGKLSQRIDADAKEIAVRFFKSNEALFSMTNSDQELKTLDVRKDARGWERVKLQQVYKSIPIEGHTMLVHINTNKEVSVVSGDYLPNVDLDTSITVQNNQAITAARTNLNPRQDLTSAPTTERIIYNFNDKPYLCWKVRLNSIDPLGNFIYYVDAKTGQIVQSYNDLKFILNRKTHNANHGSTLPGTLVRSEGSAASGDAALDAAHNNAGIVYNYYSVNFGRDSYDRSGATLISTVHFQNNYNNAFWNSTQMVYGDGDGTTFSPLSMSLDVVGHELTHAVTENESNLIYQFQSGALNESLSDIFGVLMDPSDWLLGEDVYTPGTPGDALRYLDDPPRGNQPDHMSNYVVTNQDNGGVHINSGIPNKAAYLMAAGGTHHGIAVTGMGLDAMGKVWYEANTTWLTSSADFQDARDATLNAVEAVFPGDVAKYITVRDAWLAVGVSVTGFALALDPNPVSVGKNGKTTQLEAFVTDNGNPVAGATVTFSSANTTRATVIPGSGTTATNGRLTITVTGHDKGTTNISTTATKGTNSANASVQVKVPTTSEIGMFVLTLLLSVVVLTFLKNKRRA